MKINTRRLTKRSRLQRLAIFFALLIISVSLFIIFKPSSAVPLAEINPDDWKLELLFFDSEVNKGKDPIVDEKWIIEESSKLDRFSRTVTMQINYKNETMDRTYEPGELQIVVPNPLNAAKIKDQNMTVSTTVGANGVSYNSYFWDYNYQNYNTSNFVFTNHDALEENANVEGSIQVVYVISSNTEYYAEQFDDSCTHVVGEDNMKAVLNSSAESNAASFEYSRVYNHPWTKANYRINTSVYKIQSYDGLGENADQYTWVRYYYYGASTSNSSISYSTRVYNNTSFNQQFIGLSEFRVDTVFPEGIKVVNRAGTVLEHDENYVYNMPDSAKNGCGSYNTCYDIYVGYPKSIYNAEAGTNNITNLVQLDGVYASETNEGTLATNTVSLDLSKYEFNYTGNAVSIGKYFTGATVPNTYGNGLYYYDLISSPTGQTGIFSNNFTVRYEGIKQTVRMGDDLLYYMDNDTGTTQQLPDSDYYFESITIPVLKNGNSLDIPTNKYSYSVYVRYRNENDFVKFGDYTTTNRTISFTGEKQVQAWYIDLFDLTDSINGLSISTKVTLKSTSLPVNGTLYNFNYVQVFQNGERVNEATLDNYSAGITREHVSEYDLHNYGEYQQRSVANTTWKVYSVPAIRHIERVGKAQATTPSYKPAEEAFVGSFYISASSADFTFGSVSDWGLIKDKIPDSDMNHFVKLYDLLPLGMLPDSTPEEIINSLNVCPTGDTYRQKNGASLFSSSDECQSFVKEHTTVKITKNWHNTGRWHIAIIVDFSERPFTTYNASHGNTNAYSVYTPLRFTVKYRIPYDSYAEYGRSFKNTAWRVMEHNTNNNHKYDNDNGTLDSDVVDIDDNGKSDEQMSTSDLTINLVSVTSTTQDLQVSVLTDHSGTYEVDDVLGGFGEDYVYKLRLRTGNNKVTNAVLYDHIEEKHAGNTYWQGNFDGIDTSYAESKLDYYDQPIKIKTYWSPNPDAGPLSNDNSWVEYDEETVDKSKVRSLAFQYLDQNDQPALLMQSSYSYILVKMKAPSEEDISSFAYNNLHSEWNAIDNLTGDVIYNIVGIESNTTRVYLSDKYNLTVKKVWDDYNDYYKIRPETITFNLYYDDEIVDTKTLDVLNGESEVVFENLSVLDQNKYLLEEVEVDGYKTSISQDPQTLAYTFTNSVLRAAPVELNPQTGDNIFISIACISGLLLVGFSAAYFARARR